MRLLKRKRYSDELMAKAVQECKAGNPIDTISRKYRIPRTTLYHKIKNKHPLRRGSPPMLSERDENNLVKWIEYMYTFKRPLTIAHLTDSVGLLSFKKLKKHKSFSDGRPGKQWYIGFLRRHEGLKDRIRSQNERYASDMNEDEMKSWFIEYGNLLKRETFNNGYSSRLFNITELSLPLCSKSDANRHPEEYTILVAGSAEGSLSDPMIIVKSEDNDDAIRRNLPRYWSLGISEGSCVNPEHFYNYIVHNFYPWIIRNELELPVILLLDEQYMNLTQLVTDFCCEHEILLMALSRHKTQAVQPIDFSLSIVIKSRWTRILKQMNRDYVSKLSKIACGPMLQEIFEEENMDVPRCLRSGFKKCGLYPPSFDNLMKLCATVGSEDAGQFDKFKSDESSKLLQSFEKYIDEGTLKSFRSAVDKAKWTGKTEDTHLFQVWRKMYKQIETKYCTNDPCSFVDKSDNHEDATPPDSIPTVRILAKSRIKRHIRRSLRYVNDTKENKNSINALDGIFINPNDSIKGGDQDFS